jgi:hypothetical protein
MSRWALEEIMKILQMYPKNTTSVLLQCVFFKPGFTVLNWDIDNCSFRLCRGTELTEDIILFASFDHEDMKITVVELYYANEDTCAIVHLHLDTQQILNYYREIGPALADFENAGITVQEFRKEKIKYR